MVAWAREGFIQSACSSQRHTLRDNKKQNMRVVTGVVIFHLKWSHIRSIKFFHHVFHHIKKIRHPPHLWTAIRPFLQSNSQWSARSWADKNGKVTGKTGNNYGNDWNLWKNYGKFLVQPIPAEFFHCGNQNCQDYTSVWGLENGNVKFHRAKKVGHWCDSPI